MWKKCCSQFWVVIRRSAFFHAHNLEKHLLFYFIANSQRSLNYKNHSGGGRSSAEITSWGETTWMGGSDTHARKMRDLSPDADTCQLQTAHIPLVVLRVISQGLSVFQEGFGRWEESATGQPARWWVQCSETPPPLHSTRSSKCVGCVEVEQQSEGSERLTPLGSVVIVIIITTTMKAFLYLYMLQLNWIDSGGRGAGRGISRTFHCKVFLTHFQRWDCSGLVHMAFCWWLQNSVTHWWRLDIFV